MAIATASGHPLTPFVVGEEGAGDDQDDEDGEQDSHDIFRIAWKRQGTGNREQKTRTRDRDFHGHLEAYALTS